jgi:phage baseplate assembly protein W
MALQKQLVFSDLNLTFSKHPVTGAVSVLKNADAVKRAVRNLIMTNYYERPYNPAFGGNVSALLFENADSMTEIKVFNGIKQAIANWEPRANLDNLIVDVQPDSNSLFVKIVFSINNIKEPVELDIMIDRTR